jgi:hypothetical protein
MEKKTQLYPAGTLVRITKDMPSNMSHFSSDVEAVVEYTYASEYGDGLSDRHDYGLFIIGDRNSVSAWYPEELLSFVAGPEVGLVRKQEAIAERQSFEDKWGDLESAWNTIVPCLNKPDELSQYNKALGVFLPKLFVKLFDIPSWGANGEGFVYHQNLVHLLEMLTLLERKFPAITYSEFKVKIEPFDLTTKTGREKFIKELC